MNTPRLLAVLLAASLAGNAALLLRAPRATPATASRDQVPAPSTPGVTRGTLAGESSPSPDVAAELARILAPGTLKEFRALLEAAGVEPKLRRELLQATFTHHFHNLFRETTFSYAEQMRREWWRDPVMDEYHPAGLSAKRRQEDTLALSKQFNAELADLLGEDLTRLDLEDPWTALRFSGLPPEKAEALHRIERDYQELEQEIHIRAGNFTLSSDEEKLRLLKQEKERDIAALLTPEERAEWELRASPIAQRARNHATRYRATEEEYRRIYALQKAFEEAFDDIIPFAAEQDWKARQEAEKALEAEIRAIVGDERHADARRRQSTDFTLAEAAAERLGLPADTAHRLYSLREPVAAESRRIATDPKLSPAERKTALARIAAETRAKLQDSLGREAAEAYLERGGMGWIRSLDEGVAVSFDPDNDAFGPFTAEEPSVPVIRIE